MVVHRSEDAQGSAYSPMRIVLVGARIPKIHEKPIPEQLGDMPTVALDHFGTNPLIRTDDFSILFGIESAGERGGIGYPLKAGQLGVGHVR
jgi:hypothetical protein